MDISKRKILSWVNVLTILLYALFTFILLLHHEIWADEAQAWLVVRDLDFSGLISHVRTEGHPLLWYFTIFPFAKLLNSNFSIFSMQIVNWFIVVLAMGVWVFRSPFNIFAKISMLLSSGFLYWYAIIARSYCFIPLFVFLLAIFYPKQKEHPFVYALLIIALANTHLIVFGFCFALALVFLYKNRNDKKALIASSLVFLSFICIVIYLWGSQNENYIVRNAFKFPFWEGVKDTYERMIFNFYGSQKIIFSVILSLFLSFSGLFLLFKNKAMFFVYLMSIIYQVALYVLVWGQLPQRTYSLFLVIVFCFWVMFNDLSKRLKNLVNFALIIAFLASFPTALFLIKQEWEKDFSDGLNVANFIKQNIPQDAFIVSNYPLTTVSISVYLPQNKGKWKFYYPAYKDYYTFTHWNKTINPSFTPLPLADYLKDKKEIYVLLSAGSVYEDLKPLYSSTDKVCNNQEKFKIYKITREQMYGTN